MAKWICSLEALTRVSPRALSTAVTLTLLLLGTACMSAQTRRTLDRAYELAAPRAGDAAPGRPRDSALSEAELAGTLNRDAVVAQAVARSPALAVMAHRARALVHAGRAEGSLPSAELGFEAQNLPLTRPYALGEADMYMVELRQRFPAAGSLDAGARAMAEEAQALLAELESEERLVAERADTAFADYVQAFLQKRLQEGQLMLLERMRQAVRARYSTGGSGLADAARVEVEVAKVRRAVARLEGDIARSHATLNAVLRRPPSAPLGEPRVARPETVRFSVEELMARAEANRGVALAAEARLRGAAARREARESEARVPEFMVGLGYWQEPTMRPGFGLTASMSLPWLWGPNHERIQQASEEEAAERAARDNVGLDVQTEVTEAHARLRASEAELLVVRTQGLPAARRSRDALLAAYTTGSANLLEWVDAARSVLDLEIEEVELHGELARGVASLERAIGTTLPRSSITGDTTP